MNPLITFIVVVSLGGVMGIKPIDVYWNISNPVFSGYNHVIEVNKDNHPWEYDQVNIICPSGVNSTEKHIIYSVDKQEFDSCRIANPKPRIIAVCDQPKNFMYFTITFRSFSPSPMQMEFKPGQSYYFISTASERDIHRRVGGWCSSNKMKMTFRVAESKMESSSQSLHHSRPAIFWSKYWNSRVPDLRDVYRTRDFEPDYSDSQDDLVRNSDGETRVDPRFLRTRGEKSHRYNEEFDGTNALRLKSAGEKIVFNLSVLVILLSVCILR
eukprot:GFUD01000349.1.p1 GENE.GFUD01000349.1~~GFUD01000349.1.p1  ORF type:complete len:269 (+),score=44.81 GFUD01000349.1:138-944(+)